MTDRIDITDRSLEARVIAFVAKQLAFEIIIKASNLRLDAYKRMLISFSGGTDTRSAVVAGVDAFRTSDLFTCWGLAVTDQGYRWSYKEDGGDIVVSFAPPNAPLTL